MKKFFKKTQVLIIIALSLAALIIIPSSVYALRGTETRFYGLVALDGQNVPIGSQVTARIGQLIFPPVQVYYKNGFSRYYIDVPKDTGQAVRDGGKNGDLVYFTLTVNNITYYDPEPGIWRQSLDVYHFLRLQSSQVATLKIETTTLPEGVTGVSYTTPPLEASGGITPYSWALEAGALPAGISLGSGGTLSGVPTAGGVFNLTLRVSDSLNAVAARNFSITIWKLGDANHDNLVNRLDVMEIIKMYLGIVATTPSADVNQDSKVDLRDAVKVQTLY